MYIISEVPIWRMLETQVVIRAFSRAWAKTGKRIAARMAIIAITTSSSIKVNAGFRIRFIRDLLCGVRGPCRRSSGRAGAVAAAPQWYVLLISEDFLLLVTRF